MDHSDEVERVANPRETANPLSLITFLYTRRLFVRGFKKDLEDDDLYEVIKSCRSKTCADKLEHAYQLESKKRKPSVIRILWQCYGLTYVILGIFNLFFKLLSSSLEPDAVSHLVGYFKPGQTKMTLNDALYYAGVLIGLKLIHTMYNPNYSLYLAQLAIQIRTSFCSLIYRKALKLSPKSLEKTSLGNIITIISKDVGMFEGAIMLFNELWIGVVQMLYICYLIYARVGISSTLGVLILAAAIPIQFYISKFIGKLRTKINKKTDKRLQECQEALSTIKIIKMYTWEMIFTDRISETRRKEVSTMLIKSITRLCLMVSSDFLGKVGFYVIVMFYIYLNSSVDAESIFYIMKLYATLRGTVSTMFTYGLSLIAELSASLTRINSLLILEELPEHLDKPDDEPQIDIRDASVNLKDVDILKHVTLKLKAGLSIVTGQLGCGKSSLIKLILRDLPPDSGDIRTRGRMSYASQDPWLFPATIKQNILFGEKYDYERYNKVLEVCALTYDLDILEKSDETIVQDRGMNLSKGQQARVNLARAIYKDSDIYLIDDALTALDSKVQEHIFRECIEKFLKGKLVILVTHNSRHISRAETVVILENGCVNYIGKHQDLSNDILQALEEEGHEQEKPPPTPLFEDKSKEITEKTVAEHTKLITPPPNKHKQIYHEVKKSGGVALNVYVSYVKYGGGLLMILLMIFSYFGSTFTESSSQVMLTNWVNYKSELEALAVKHFENSTDDIEKLVSLYFPAYSKNTTSHEKSDVISNVETVHPNLPDAIDTHSQSIPLIPSKYTPLDNDSLYEPIDFSSLTEEQNKTYHIFLDMGKLELQATKSLNLYTIALIASIVFEFIKNYTVFKFATKASINLHKAMINSVVSAKMSFFDTFFVGNILNRFSQDLNIVDEHLPIILSMLIGAGFMVGGIVGMMAHVNLRFLAPALAVLVLLVLMRFIYMPTARSLKRLEAATRSPIIGHLNSSMEGLTTVRAYKAQDILRNEFDKHQDVYTSARYTSLCVKNAFSFYMDFSAVLLNIFIIGRFLFFDTDTLAGDVGLTITQSGALTMVLQFALMQWSEAESMMTSVERVIEYTKVQPERTDGQDTPNWPSKGEVIYKGVSMTYTNSTEKVLNNINFKVESSEKIGIVGRTGAGKSSIISTLFRLYNHEGTILIDGIDTRTLSLKYLRQHISIIPQDPIMFSGTIRTNIDPLKEFTDEEIWKVLHKVNLDNKVPNLECVCEDTNFSSGERQLLSLSRAIIRRNKIVVLDEATANMDPETEQLVQKAIDFNFSTCTVFIIAHRIDSIINCNKVMVLNRGEIVEFDDPKKLLLDPNSTFFKMVKAAGTMGH